MRSSLRVRRIIGALLLLIGGSAATAGPSAAATTNVTWDISGHITTHWNQVTSLLNDHTGTTICVPATSGNWTVATHVDDATGTTHINGATAFGGMDPEDFIIAGTNYQRQFSGTSGTTTGTINPVTDTFTTTLKLHVAIRNCAGTSTLCTYALVVPMAGHNYNGGAVPATGNSVTLSGSSAPINPAIGCNVAIRPDILGSTTGFVFHLLAH